ncbi:hypothetical protein DPMN_001622 [Dreissena polymorpha]|uniref:Uncharacterized protein n=1 Tax=Dreissena polymorpha TaxID=45954 RepID=A0A9D4MKM9_DREPO|nr:hypothetical protein DPMN_001622 [Dreissena polymorpha]
MSTYVAVTDRISQPFNSGVHLTTTAVLFASRVSTTIPSRKPPAATLSMRDTWIQDSFGNYVPVTSDNSPSISGFNYQCVDFTDSHSSLLENHHLVQDNPPIIPTTVSMDSLHTSGVVDSEHDSDADNDQYLAPIDQIYDLMVQTLGEEYCSRPVEVFANSTISVTEQLVHKFDPNSVTKANSRLDTRLPIGASVLSVFQSLESINTTIPK